MIFNLSEQNSIANRFLSELRSVSVQKDRMRFRRNLERLGEVIAYEISKSLPSQPIVLATILRAGLPLHQGMLNYFDDAGNAFVSAYRKHHRDGTFEIHLEYVSCPNLEGTVLILSDPMLATGASMALAAKELQENGIPAEIHFVTAIASSFGIEHMERLFPQAHIWVGAVDEELTAKSYIVPGLGDAGDLSYGLKVQE